MGWNGGQTAAETAEMVFYVSPEGDDGWSGKLPAPNDDRTDGPFASVHRAQEAIREWRRGQGGMLPRPVTVYLRGGTYFLREPLRFTPEDSGTPQCPITFAAYPGETPVLSGGRRIEGWRQRDGEIWEASLPEAQTEDWSFRLLRVGDRWAIRARYPNFDEERPLKGGWLFAQWWGKPWERGQFNVGVGRIHNPGDRLEWRIEIPAAGTYTVWLRYAHHMKAFDVESMDGRTTLRVEGGEAVPLRHLPDTGGWGELRWARTATIALPAGEHTLIWENQQGGGLNLDALCLTDDPDWNPKDAIQIQGDGAARVQPPREGAHLLVVQAEACTRAVGKEITIATPSFRGNRTRLVIAPERFPDWEQWKGAEVHLFPAWGWVNVILKVKRVEKAQHTLIVDCGQEIWPGNRFFIANVREALDAPGEWYLDAQEGKLLYWPTSSDFPDVEVVAPAMDRLLILQGNASEGRFVEHLRFRNLTFTDADYTAPGGYYSPADAAIWMVAARQCVVEDCTFRHLGGYAVRLEARSRENEIVGNMMAGLGGGGVILLGNTATQPTRNLIAANDIHDGGQVYKHVAGVYVVTGSDNRIVHNRIRRMPRYGISLKSIGPDNYSHNNLVEFNEILDTNLETNDTGAIETLGRDRQPSGNVIRYNLIRNVVGLKTTPDGEFLSPHFTWGIYLDDYSSGTTVYGNLVIDTVLGALCIHGGKDNVVENNIFVDGKEHQIRLQPRDDFMTGNVFRRNIVVYRDPKAVLWYSWSRTWRPDRFAECDRNLYWHTGGLDLARTDRAITPEGSFAQWQAAGLDRHSVIADPRFVAPDAGDFRLQADSPAFRLGFQPLPLDRIGPKGFSR